ncbi:MAG: GntR family transcriptional regulator [Abditibacteriales bacterium]|nr:GntR family transcriptional regulator [Abditibacteriales bacterium]MDW8365035.1 GntR family transcriptional regulator [Abditibacteriales bacterium]
MPLLIRNRIERRNARLVHQQIKEMLRASIERGEMRSGEMLPGRLELCRLFGANRLSVDRAVTDLVKEGWLIAVKGKGTFVAGPPSAESAAVSAPTLTLGVVWSVSHVSDENHYWGPLLRGISYEAGERNIRLLFRQLPLDGYGDFFRTAGVEGLIVLASRVREEAALQGLRQAGIPFVATSSAYDDQSLPCVATDNAAGVRQVLEHLWGLGHRAIGMVVPNLSSTDDLRRWEAYQTLMGEAGLVIDPRWVLLAPERESVRWEERLRGWLESMPLPTAIFAAEYKTALLVWKVLRERGVAVPGAVSLVGFDDPTSAELLELPLTTVRQRTEVLGRRAVEKLCEALAKGVIAEGTELLMPELIVRQTTAPCR